MTAAAQKFERFADFYPFYSFIGDWVMYANTWTGKIKF